MTDLDALFRQVIEATNDVILITKADPIDEPGPEIVYVNAAFERLTGYSASEVLGKNPRILQSEETASEDRERIRQALKSKQAVRTTIKNVSKHGRSYYLDISIIPLLDKTGNLTHFAAIERDVTEQKELALHLEKLSRTDGLTGLLNHRAFHTELKKEANRVRRIGKASSLSVIVFDIDYFKSVNDNYGHDIGDLVLKKFGEMLIQEFRNIDSAGRLGGEEFCVILPATSVEGAKISAERFRKRVEKHKFSLEQGTISVTVSIGISIMNESDQDYSEALKRADQALYAAKKNGRNQTCISEKDSS